ncbi:MAG: SusC/RagA family TonB-linked outer membrane protein [Bacteroidales bacterium]
MRKFIMLLSLFVMGSLMLQAQTITVKGRVTSKSDGSSLPGVTVKVKEVPGKGTITDVNGDYSIAVDAKHTLEFSFVGMQPISVKVEGKSVINVEMVEAITKLDELVVVGYGVRKKSLLTTAISQVSSEEIVKAQPLRVEQALQGKTAGVQIIPNSGQPGDRLTVRIRGTGTTGDADPLFIVDGMPVGGIDYLNPNDIESVEIMKDAASTAIYGARGANGVVMITTKKGKEGKIKVEYDFTHSTSNIWRKMAVLNVKEYTMIMNEAYANDNSPIPFPKADSLVAALGNGTDWQEEILYKNAPSVNHQITISGGSNNSRYYSSFSYANVNGTIAKDKSNYERYTFRVNSDHKSGILTYGNNLTYVQKITRGIDPNSEYSSPLTKAVNMDPITPVKEPDGSWGKSKYASQEIVNPVGFISILNSQWKEDKLVGDVWGQIEPFKGLRIRSSFGIDLANGFSRSFTPVYDLGGNVKTSVSEASATQNRWFTWQNENVISYTSAFKENHHYTVMAGMTANSYRHDYVGGRKTNLLFNDFEHAFINNGTDEESYRAWGGAEEHALLSYFGRLNYDFKNKYLFEGVLRADGSSNFGTNNRYGYFPAFSAGWIMSEEEFMAGVPGLSYLKLRAGWGQNGNEAIGAFRYTSLIGAGARYTFGSGEVIYTGSVPTGIANPDLKWETSEQTNIGFDARFLDDRLSLGFNWYRKMTKDLLVVAPIPAFIGNGAPAINGGSVKNTGVEIELGLKGKMRDIKYDLMLSGGYNKNTMVSINNEEGKLYGAGVHSMNNICMAIVGEPIAFFWGYKTAGVFQNQAEIDNYKASNGQVIQPNAKPGDLKFVDLNDDGVIDNKDRTNIGNPYPDVTLGLNFSAEYHGFDFNMFWYGAFGQEIFNGTRRFDLPMSNWSAWILDRWTGEGTSDRIPRVTIADPNQNFIRPSDLYVEDGSFVRLKNITLGYTLPTSLSQKVKIERLRVFISANNLLTFTGYSGFDPEIGANWALDVGIDRNVYPQPRTITFGFNCSL